MSQGITRSIWLASAAMALAACGTVLNAESASIQIAKSEADFDKALAARWQIEIYSGPGLPGSPGAGQYVKNYREVLQNLVDECELGPTVLTQATDGVSLLSILDAALTSEQVSCIRNHEQAGLRLIDRGSRS